MTIGPIGELTGRDHSARILLPRSLDRDLEVDLLAPGERRRRDRQRGRDRTRGRRIEQLGVERERAEIEANARHSKPPLTTGTAWRIFSRRATGLGARVRPEVNVASRLASTVSPRLSKGAMQNLQSASGIFALLAIAWIVSEDRRGVAWTQAAVALLVTFATAVILLKVPGVRRAFAAINSDSRSRFACDGAALCNTRRTPTSPIQRLRSASSSGKSGPASSERSR